MCLAKLQVAKRSQQCDHSCIGVACLVLAFLFHGYETIIQPFCCSYSVAGHEALQSAGFAPRLLGSEKLPGRWLMVVTEPLLGACMFDQMDAFGEAQGRAACCRGRST